MDKTSAFAWLRVTFAVIGAFVFCGVLGAFTSGWLHLWALPIIGFVAAFGVVLTAYLFAPAYRLGAAFVALCAGAAAAWRLVGHEDFPANYGSLAYQPTYIPFLAALAGGVAALALGYALHRRRARKLGA